MTVKIGVVMDPISEIVYETDGTLALLWEAQRRGWSIFYMENKDIYFNEKVYANAKQLEVFRDPNCWFKFNSPQKIALTELDVILMRKDPPVDMEYFYITELLENAEQHGVLVLNKPQGLRDANEKLYIQWFPQCCPETLVTSSIDLLKEFLKQHQEIVVKPLEAMGGISVFRVANNDVNCNVIIETLTHFGERFVMAQRFIADIYKKGDKRIFLINGEPMPYALVRIPAKNDFRGNIVAGATGHGAELTEHDRWICQQVGPKLREKGLIFVGLDVIGDYLTEINVTSPTGIRQIESFYKFKIAEKFFDYIGKQLEIRNI